MTPETFSAPAELKFALDADAPPGTISGIASAYGVLDSHHDVVTKGAFSSGIAAGRLPRMYLNHSAFLPGGSPLTVGLWSKVDDTDTGLRVTGRLYDIDHPEINLLRENIKNGQIDALSIAFHVPEGGAVLGRKAGEPKRTLNKVDLISVDFVGIGSNPLARIDSVKSAADARDAACASLCSAADLHSAALSSGNGAMIDHSKAMMNHVQAAHVALTGLAIALKFGFTTVRDFEEWLHRHRDDGGMGFSNTKAREIGNLVFKTLPRDEGSGSAGPAKEALLKEISASITGFSLPKL